MSTMNKCRKWTDEEIALITEYLKYMEYLAKWNGELPDVVTDGSVNVVIPTPREGELPRKKSLLLKADSFFFVKCKKLDSNPLLLIVKCVIIKSAW